MQTLLTLSLLLTFLLATRALAGGVRSSASSSVHGLHRQGNCNGISATLTQTPGTPASCHSLGLVYLGGACASQEDCQDFSLPMHLEEEEFYIVITHPGNSSLVYYQGYQKAGGLIELLASKDSKMPEAFNVTTYSSEEETSFETMIQTMTLRVSCHRVWEQSQAAAPVRVVFSSQTPPTYHWHVELAANSSTESSWGVEFLLTSLGDFNPMILDHVGLLEKGDAVQIPLGEGGLDPEVDDGELGVSIELVSIHGERCIVMAQSGDDEASVLSS